jgi:hypothetical protein
MLVWSRSSLLTYVRCSPVRKLHSSCDAPAFFAADRVADGLWLKISVRVVVSLSSGLPTTSFLANLGTHSQLISSYTKF